MNKVVALIGNPNCGKTTIFNALTGAHQSVGNWPGVTVEKKSGFFEKDNQTIEVVDLPGIYSLSVVSSDSEDEKITRDFLLFEKPDYVINIVDASNLERSLYITLQLLEMKLPVILVLNMMDVALSSKIKIDVAQLVKCLNLPVVEMVASKSGGMEALKKQILQPATVANEEFTVSYDSRIEQTIETLLGKISDVAEKKGWPARWFSVHLLDGDTDNRLFEDIENREEVEKIREAFSVLHTQEADTLIAQGRYDLIDEYAQKVVKRGVGISKNFTEWADKIALGRFTGLPFFILMMYLMFVWTINVGGLFIDPIAEFSELYLVEKLSLLLKETSLPSFVSLLLCDGVGQGLTTVATFIPPIAFLFLFLSVLEDSGYMARAAFVTDRLMRKLGLPGTAFVPMVVAFGCTVPAVMGTRILSSKRDRLITLVMTPFMSCGARLPVYALFATAFFYKNGSDIVFALYLIGIVIAVLTGLLFKSTVLKGDSCPLVLEIPLYHVPVFKNVAVKTWDKLKGFIVRAGVLIVPMVIVLNLLNCVDVKGNFVPEAPHKSALSSIGRTITPVFKPIGISEENWPATVGLFTGVLAKEALIGTLDSLYATLSDASENKAEDLNITTKRLVSFFDGRIGAFAYLLFVLMYAPCLAAVAAIAKEFGVKWAVVTTFWTTGQAYLISSLFYQSALLYTKGTGSVAWIVGVCCFEIVIVSIFFALRNVKGFEGLSASTHCTKACAKCCSRCAKK